MAKKAATPTCSGISMRENKTANRVYSWIDPPTDSAGFKEFENIPVIMINKRSII